MGYKGGVIAQCKELPVAMAFGSFLGGVGMRHPVILGASECTDTL